MKIALVSPYDFAYPGGVVNHISALEQQFVALGHDVRIIAPASKGTADLGERFIPIGKPRPVPVSGSIARISISLNLASRIKEVLAAEKFDVVHLHEPFMPMLCSAVLRFSDAANIGTFHACHGSPGYKWGWPISAWMIQRRRRKLHGKIAVSQPALDYSRRFIPGDYTIIPNGVDVNHFTPDVAPIEELCDGKLNILFVGRMERRKGLDFLLQAYPRIRRQIPNCRLIIVGPGTRSRRKYEKIVARHNLPDVVFTGRVSYDELPRYYKTADIYCSPATSRESFGIVLLEAMAVGKTIVASNIDGYANLLHDGDDGILVPPRNVASLAETLISLLADKARRESLGKQGLIRAQEYSWEKVSRQILDYYQRILQGPPWHRDVPETETMPL